MSRRSRLLLAAAALLIGATYFLPLWKVQLVAPQYPEGLGMYISVDRVEGVSEHDIRNINALNHYIGMKPIEPDAIPELRFMPMVLAVLIVTGLLAAIIGKRFLLYGWLALFVLVAVAGLADFYRWGYDYGHNLDLENAAIKIPGMAYQPPLIGRKQLLNITATSWPALGGLALLASMLMTVLVGAVEARTARKARHTTAAFAVLALLLAGCASGPQPIAYGKDECSHCQMAIMDQRYATELITAKGKVHKFDSIECLASFDAMQGAKGDHRFVTPYNAPGTLVPVDDALIVRSPKLPSPMGANLTAFTDAEADQLKKQYGGTVWSEWPMVVEFVRASRLHEMPD
jgi:copper chaperone NosL